MKDYQNITTTRAERGKPERKESAFFNEGKWNNFIEPFLPADCRDMTFIDFGCNYGVHMKLARRRGFKTVVGIEANKDLSSDTLEYLGTLDGVFYVEIDQEIFTNSFVAELPATDYALMANFHYHLFVADFVHLLNLLRRKTRYVIVVSAELAHQKLYRAERTLEAVRRYFAQWEEVEVIRELDVENDPSPRNDLFSVLFKTEVERIAIDDIQWGPYKRSFYRNVKSDMLANSERRPMTHPIMLRSDRSIADGFHRLASEELSGARTILCEII